MYRKLMFGRCVDSDHVWAPDTVIWEIGDILVAWMWPVSWPWTQRWLHVFLPAPCVCGCCPAPSGSAPPSPASCPAGAAGSIGRSLSPEPRSGRSAPAPLPDGPRCPLNATPAPTEVGQSLNKAVQGREYDALQCVLTSNLLTWPLWNSSLFSRSHTRASCLLTMLRPTVDDSRNCTLDTLCWSCTTMRWRERRAKKHTFRETNNSSGECDRAPPAGLWRGGEFKHLIHKHFMFWSSHLFLQRVSLLLHLLQFSLKLSDLSDITGGLNHTETQIWFWECKKWFTRAGEHKRWSQKRHLSNERFVLLHQFVQVLLVLLQPLQ